MPASRGSMSIILDRLQSDVGESKAQRLKDAEARPELWVDSPPAGVTLMASRTGGPRAHRASSANRCGAGLSLQFSSKSWAPLKSAAPGTELYRRDWGARCGKHRAAHSREDRCPCPVRIGSGA